MGHSVGLCVIMQFHLSTRKNVTVHNFHHQMDCAGERARERKTDSEIGGRVRMNVRVCSLCKRVDILVKWCAQVCLYVHVSHSPSAASSPVLHNSHTISINLHQMVCFRTREVCVRVLARQRMKAERSRDRNYNSRMIAMPRSAAYLIHIK